MGTFTLDKTANFVLIAVLVLMPIVSHAGGLGVAPLVFILGLLGLVFHLKEKDKLSPPFWALMIFLTWVCSTAMWSPYKPDNILTNYIKLFIMGPVFFFTPLVFKHIAQKRLPMFQNLFLATTCLSLLLVTTDIWAGFKITLFFNPASTADELARRLSDVQPNLSHALTVLLLLSAPVTILFKTHFKAWKLLAFLFFCLLFMASYKHGLAISMMGTICVMLTLFLALRFPESVFRAVVILGGFTLICAPVTSYISSLIVDSDLHNIPGSWEHRIRMWAYCWPKILENPLIGSGFDAVRTFDEEYITRNGIHHTIVSLHPHNMGLHIWVETGLIGVVLASGVIFASFKTLKQTIKGKEKIVLLSGILMAAILISLVTYGVWQFWWWASFFFSIGLIYFLPSNS